MNYTLTYSMEQVRSWGLWALVGRITNEQTVLIFTDEIVYAYNLPALQESCQRYLPSMTGSHQMKSGESWRTFTLP